MLPPNYSTAVLACYHQKLAANDLSIDIRQLSPASLKAACLEECRERYDRKDERILKGFFGQGSDQQACLLAIDDLDINKFRPLVYFIKGKTKNPDDKVVELVAWLIDFKHRPYDPRKDYSIAPHPPQETLIDKGIDVSPTGPAGNENGLQPISPEHIEDSPKTISPEARIERKKSKRIILAITISIAFGIVVFWSWPRKPMPPRMDGTQSCMFWADDHYQPISCSQKLGNALVIPLDSDKMAHFRKITRPDTITENALGSIWCVKFHGAYECYTSPGYHPIDTSLKLRLLTDYILIKHIHPNQEAEKTSQ
jgi:hypothetical protein